jgi:F-type H+-transporting ATPase subunit delta
VEELAQVYARSLFEVAREQGKLDEIKQDLGELADAIADSHDLQVFFFSPYFSTDEKKAALGTAIDGADPAVINFLELLIENHRMPVLFRIRRAFEELWRQENKLLPVDVTSAIELDEAIVKQIGDRIGEQTEQRIELTSHVDPDILGGIVVRVGNSILDASIANRLEQLRKQVAKAG